MTDYEKLAQGIIDAIIDSVDPKAIILFGSQTCNDELPNSDTENKRRPGPDPGPSRPEKQRHD